MKKYKLTNQNLQTHKGFRWKIGEEMLTDGSGELCSKGWLHAYDSPLLAVLHNPIHANIHNPRLFKVECAGDHKDDHGIKCGFTRMKLIKELKLPVITTIQRVAYGILCSLKVYKDPAYVEWAKNWLSGEDRSKNAAYAAADAANAANAATYAANANVANTAYAADAAYAAYAAATAAANAADAANAANAAATAANAATYAAAAKPVNLVKLAKRAMKIK